MNRCGSLWIVMDRYGLTLVSTKVELHPSSTRNWQQLHQGGRANGTATTPAAWTGLCSIFSLPLSLSRSAATLNWTSVSSAHRGDQIGHAGDTCRRHRAIKASGHQIGTAEPVRP